MVRHIVLLRLQPATTRAQRDAIVEGLRALPAAVGTLRSFTIAQDLGLAPGNADLALVAEFDDEAGYSLYRDHPAHLRVIAEQIRPVLAERTAIQHEC